MLLIAVSSEDRATTTAANTSRKLSDIRTCGFWDMLADEQANRHADRPTVTHSLRTR